MDPFLNYSPPAVVTAHKERAHSKYAASGAERWFNCAGSVELSEGIESKSSKWALEGTEAHEVLENVLTIMATGSDPEPVPMRTTSQVEMYRHAFTAARFILGLRDRAPGSELLVETRIRLDFIHPEMFGTFDGAVVDHFGTLHVVDYKYGAGVPVSPVNNLQMIFYAIGLAHKYHWNFSRVRVWIIQPRIKNYEGPLYWELSTLEMKRYVRLFRDRVKWVEANPELFVEGSWCHWCNAKSVCPMKREKKLENAQSIFAISPLSF